MRGEEAQICGIALLSVSSKLTVNRRPPRRRSRQWAAPAVAVDAMADVAAVGRGIPFLARERNPMLGVQI